MCQNLGRLSARTWGDAVHVCAPRMPFALTAPPADDTDGGSSAVNRESMPRISIGDCSLYYERHGMGFPILFVSGLGGFASFWQDQIAAFTKRFEVIIFDHRGNGQS